MAEPCNLQIHVNSRHIFAVNEEIISKFSAKLRRIIKREKRRIQIRNSGIEIVDFPGGPDGFELVSRYCYSNGKIPITVSNVAPLHCCALFLGMNEKSGVSPNLFDKTEDFLEGMFYWTWNDIISCLKSCESFFSYAESSPSNLIQNLMNSLLAKIAQNSDINLITSSSSSSCSPDTPASGITASNSCKRTWWFNDLTSLPPQIIENFVKTLGGYGSDNNSLVLTRFLLHYLKSSTVKKTQKKSSNSGDGYFGNIADTAVHGVILMGKSSFSCRGLFSVLRVVSGFGLSRESRYGVERLIGGVLDEATVDDLLVSCCGGGVYDVNLVVRLIRFFVNNNNENNKVAEVKMMKMKKVGRLIDKYLREIAPDHNLKIAKFVGVAESLPDFARDCFDGVYRAIDIYLQSHPTLSLEERSRICRCLNYEKLSLEACKDLAKNLGIPPRIAVQALASQHPRLIITNLLPTKPEFNQNNYYDETTTIVTPPFIRNSTQMVMYEGVNSSCPEEEEEEEEDIMRLNLQRMQWRVVESERECREMKGKMSRIVKNATAPPHVSYNYKGLPRLC